MDIHGNLSREIKLRRADPANGDLGPVKVPEDSILRVVVVALLGLCHGVDGLAVAQEDRPEITPNERKVPAQKRSGTACRSRAADGSQWQGIAGAYRHSGERQFWDATAYKADPFPMALESGTVYEAERTGNSLGLFTSRQRPAQQCRQRPESMDRDRGMATRWNRGAEDCPRCRKRAGGNRYQRRAASSSHGGSTASGSPPASTAPGGTSTAPPAGNSAPPPPSQPTGKSDSGDEPPRLSRPAGAFANPTRGLTSGRFGSIRAEFSSDLRRSEAWRYEARRCEDWRCEDWRHQA